jgi:hypothetical protein
VLRVNPIYYTIMLYKKTIYQSNSLRAVLYTRDTHDGRLCCEFDYLDNKRDGFPALRESPYMCAKGMDVLRIDTSSNNWFLSDDIDDLSVSLETLANDYDECVSICFSMGIMGALMFSDVLKIRKILAFSPVVSIFEDDISDRRFKSFRKYVQNPSIREAWKGGFKGIEGSVCYDPLVPIDVLQARLINEFYNGLKPVALTAGGHPCVRIIKDAMGIKPVQNLVINNQFAPANVRQLHKQSRRNSKVYRDVIDKNRSK